MKDISDGIRILPGLTDILIVAPHGPFIDGAYQNDIRTGIIAEAIHHELGCYAIVNDLFFKPKGPIKKNAQQYFLDLYRIDHAGKVPGYLDRMMDVTKREGKTTVVWVHGITDEFAVNRGKEHMGMGIFRGPPEGLQALIGYGQGGDPKTGDAQNCFSARQDTVDRFRDCLTASGMNTVLTHPDCDNYRGRDTKRLNQWFLQHGFDFERVESIQLEIKESGFRDSEENAKKTAMCIAHALEEICRNDILC